MNHKFKPHRFVLLALLILLGVLVSPVCAYYKPMDINPADGGTCLNYVDGICVDNTGITKQSYEDTISVSWHNESKVISVINIYQALGTTTNFTLAYGNGSTVTGFSAYTYLFPGYSRREIMLGGDYASQDFVDLNQVMDLVTPQQDRYIISYASNMTEDGVMISQGFMIHNPAVIGQNILAYYPVTNFHTDLITGFDITASDLIDVYIWSDTAENTIKLADFTSTSLFDNAKQWINFAVGIGSGLFAFVSLLFAIIKFFFWDNFLMVILLYLSVSMAYSAISTRDIWGFYKKFFKFQRSMLAFIIELWNYLVNIISSFRGIFRI